MNFKILLLEAVSLRSLIYSIENMQSFWGFASCIHTQRALKRSGGTMLFCSRQWRIAKKAVPPVPFATVCGSLQNYAPPQFASPTPANGGLLGLAQPPIGGRGGGLPAPLLSHANWGRIAPKPPPQEKKPAEKAAFFSCSKL